MINFFKSFFRLNAIPYLYPLRDIEKIKGEKYGFTWRSLSKDSKFSLAQRCFGVGWYMLELEVAHRRSNADACLYVDSGNGFNNKEKFFLPLRTGRITKRLMFLPDSVRDARLEPLGSPGFFSVKHFRIVRLPPWFAYDRLAQRLANMHVQYRGLEKRKVITCIKKQAKLERRHWRELALDYYSETFVRRKQGRDYQSWICEVENRLLSSSSLRDDSGPLISLLLPTYNTDVVLLRACIESVLAQTYPHWQLCIADDASADLRLRECLQEYQSRDKRIQVVFRPENGHIAAASNSALEIAKGEYVALLDHDDTLAPQALHRVYVAIAENPQVQLVYSDEDKIDAVGERFDPHFKPGWNPDLLLCQNYICHLTVLNSQLVNEVGGFREGTEGSQDHDLLLRCLPHLHSDNVVHIPEMLYHWRAVEGSTALAGVNKGYAMKAGLRAVADYLERESLPARVEPGVAPNTYNVRWELPEPAPLVSLLVPTRDGIDILKPCVDAILSRTDYPNYELLILDNQSRCTKTLDYLYEVTADPRVSVHRWDHPFNYSTINNFGASIAKGEILGLINNDIEPINGDWLREMVSHACRPEIGCVGAKLYYPNDTIQHGGVILGIGGVAGHAHKYFHRSDYGYFSRLHLVQNLSAVTGACLLVRKSIFEQVGGLNEENLAVAFNDVDLCLKVREAGYRNLWTPNAELYHHESVSRGADDTAAKRRRAQGEAEYMRKRWGKLLDTDPAYNPNLTLVHEDFSLA